MTVRLPAVPLLAALGLAGCGDARETAVVHALAGKAGILKAACAGVAGTAEFPTCTGIRGRLPDGRKILADAAQVERVPGGRQVRLRLANVRAGAWSAAEVDYEGAGHRGYRGFEGEVSGRRIRADALRVSSDSDGHARISFDNLTGYPLDGLTGQAEFTWTDTGQVRIAMHGRGAPGTKVRLMAALRDAPASPGEGIAAPLSEWASAVATELSVDLHGDGGGTSEAVRSLLPTPSPDGTPAAAIEDAIARGRISLVGRLLSPSPVKLSEIPRLLAKPVNSLRGLVLEVDGRSVASDAEGPPPPPEAAGPGPTAVR